VLQALREGRVGVGPAVVPVEVERGLAAAEAAASAEDAVVVVVSVAQEAAIVPVAMATAG
jgi:hypothetical protein